MERRVRDAVPGDAAALLAIYRPYVTDTTVSFETEPPDEAEFARRIATARERWAWLVAEIDGRVAGYAYGSSYRARAAYRYSTEVSAYVHEDFRGRGVGRELYLRLFEALSGLGYCTAYAGIALPNEASIALHRSVGFEPVGVFRQAGWKFDRWNDVSWWQRPLRDRPPGL